MPTFGQWTERLKVYNDYIKALGEYKKAEAEAEKKRAEAKGDWAKARAMELLVKQMEKDLKSLNRLRNRTDKAVEEIKKKEQRVLFLLRGRRIEVFLDAWRACDWFTGQAMLESPKALYDIKVPPEARDADNFIDNRKPDGPCEPLPSSHKNALQLTSWLREKQYMSKTGWPAQQTLVELLAAVNSVAAQTVAKMREGLEAMKKGTYNAWTPVLVPGVPADTTANRIEKAGAKE